MTKVLRLFALVVGLQLASVTTESLEKAILGLLLIRCQSFKHSLFGIMYYIQVYGFDCCRLKFKYIHFLELNTGLSLNPLYQPR